MVSKPNFSFLFVALLMGLLNPNIAQEFTFKELSFLPEEKLFLIAEKDTLVVIGAFERIDVFGTETIKGTLDPNEAMDRTKERFDFENFTPIAIADKNFFIQNGLGKVYQFEHNKFQRLDKSFFLRNHFGSNIFEHEGQIYNYGGYGFWNFHDFMVRYSEKMKEWNLHTHPSKIIPAGRKGAFFHKMKDKFIAFGGEGSKGFLTDFFVFDFDKNEFTTVGEINPEFPFDNATLFTTQNKNTSYYLMANFQWLKIDFDAFTYQISNKISGLAEYELSSNLLIHKDTLYFTGFKNDKHRLCAVSLEKLDTLFGPPKNLIVADRFNILAYIAISLFGLLMLRFAIVFIRWKNIKKTTPLLQNRYLTFKKSIIILTEEEKSIFTFLMHSQGASSQELSQLECYAEYSESYRLIATLNDLKSLSEKIDGNKSISKVLSIKKITDPNDRRQKKYKLQGESIVYRGAVHHFFSFSHSFAS